MTESEGGLTTNVKVPLLQYIPMAWAPYFMAAQLPEAARRTLHQLLTEGHVTEQQCGYTYATGDVDVFWADRCESLATTASCK